MELGLRISRGFRRANNLDCFSGDRPDSFKPQNSPAEFVKRARHFLASERFSFANAHHVAISLENSQTKPRSDCLKASLRSGLRYARTAQFSASVATQPKKLTPNENHKYNANRRARRAFAWHRKPVRCTERCSLYRRSGLDRHDGQNQGRHERWISQRARQDLEGLP